SLSSLNPTQYKSASTPKPPLPPGIPSLSHSRAPPTRQNPSPTLADDQLIIYTHSLSRLPLSTIWGLRSVCKSWLSLTSNPRFIKSQLSRSTDNIFSWLPELVVYNIFLSLNVKDLSRIKSVCKSWLSLISCRHFVKTHLAKFSDDSHLTHHRLMFCNAPFITHEYRPYVDFSVRGGELVLTGCSVHSLINGEVTKSDKLYNPVKDMDNWTYVVGYCNGLVCLACFDGSVFLWNPSTTESTRLPKYGIPHTVFGFGYDERKDDYKVFTIIGDRENKVSVYSSNSGCWRVIGEFPFGKLSFETCRGQFAFGALHWLVNQGDRRKDIIVALDMNTETHREVLQPDFGEDVYDLTLGTLGNSLSVVCQYKSGADIWVMKEHGVAESWTKLFTFWIPVDLPWKPRIRPICMLVNGDVIMLSDLTMILFNPGTEEIQMLFDTWENPSYNIFKSSMCTLMLKA
ncbi:F-box/kelch-repeat protein At3g23880, partial [Daucus carota subsp. sativus]